MNVKSNDSYPASERSRELHEAAAREWQLSADRHQAGQYFWIYGGAIAAVIIVVLALILMLTGIEPSPMLIAFPAGVLAVSLLGIVIMTVLSYRHAGRAERLMREAAAIRQQHSSRRVHRR